MVLQALRDPLKLFTDFVVTPASYIVFTDGSRYYAKNGSTGQIEYSDVDATKTIQYAIDRVKALGGGKVHIRRGNYYLSDQILIQNASDIVVEGEGWGTKLIATNPDQNIIKIGERLPIQYDPNNLSVAKRVVIRNLFLDGSAQSITDNNTNSVNFDGRIGIEVVGNFEDIVIEKCFIYNTGSDGIFVLWYGANKGNVLVINNVFDGIRGYYGGFHVHGTSKHKIVVAFNQFFNLKSHAIRHGYMIIGNYIENVDFTGTYHATYGDDYAILGSDDANIIAFNYVKNVAGGGIFYWNGGNYDGTRAVIVGNIIWNVTKNGIYAAGKSGYIGRAIIADNIIWGTGGDGIYAGYYAMGWLIKGNYVENAGSDGIDISGCNYCTAEDNVIVNPSRNGDGAGSGIRAYGIGLTLIGNHVRVTSAPRPGFGIVIGSNMDVRIIGGSIVSDVGFRSGIIGIGTGSVVEIRNVYGYRTQNSGVATISAGSTRVTVSHGLATTPSKVLITPLAQPPGKLWVENITSTSFNIVTDTAPSSDLNVAWYAEV
jgi:hypothetical protein